MAAIYLIIAFIFNAVASIFLKLQSLHKLELDPHAGLKLISHNIYFLTAVAFFGLNIIFYTLSLSRISLSVANIVMVVMSFIIVSTFSVLYFKEQVTLLQYVGYGLMIVGLVLVVLSAKAA
jgi:multidrug transporter EmrE-like cation transporter